MKKTGVLNRELSQVIAAMGHTDTLVIADCGLPIPSAVKAIDLAVKPGLPPFMDVLQTVLTELQVEKVTLAEELRAVSPQFHQTLRAALGDIPVEYVPHAQFKLLTGAAAAVVRTGECTPYANIILSSGVVF